MNAEILEALKRYIRRGDTDADLKWRLMNNLDQLNMTSEGADSYLVKTHADLEAAKADAPKNGHATKKQIVEAAMIEQAEEKTVVAAASAPEVDLATADPEELGLDIIGSEDDARLNDEIVEAKRKAGKFAPATTANVLPFVPTELKVKPNWVRWKLEQANGRLTKVPYQLNGNKASSTDPATWGTYEAVVKGAVIDETQGIGIMTDGSFVGFDLDGCRNPTTGEITEWAKRVIGLLSTYCEITPSSTGVRVYALGELPDGARRFSLAVSAGFGDKVGIETYSEQRYFTITGNRLNETSTLQSSNVQQAYELCAQISRQFPSDKRKSATSFQSNDSNSSSVSFEPAAGSLTSKFAVLMYGTIDSSRPFVIEDEYGSRVSAPSQSEADMALATLLAMKHGENAEAIDSDFRESALYRPKWDRLAEKTIQKAIQYAKRVNAKTNNEMPKTSTMEIGAAAAAKAEEVRAAAAKLDAWLAEDSEVVMDKDEAIKAAALLGNLEYSISRKKIAKKLGITQTSALDAAREKLLPEEDVVGGQGEEVVFEDVKPWHEPVDTAELLNEMEQIFKRYVYFQRPEDSAIPPVWCMMTWNADKMDLFPYFGARSPEKECGKTTLLTIIKYLSYRALSAANVTSASVFRVIEMYEPTLIIDELDTFLMLDPQLVGVFNSGHSREMGYIIRTVGDEHEPRRFKTFGPKAYGMIGCAVDTFESRSIPVFLFPKVEEDGIQELDLKNPAIKESLTALARKLARWSKDNKEKVLAIEPDTRGITNRTRDNWKPLLQIAEFAGRGWVQKIRNAAGMGDPTIQKNENRQFLEDVRNIFHTRGVDFIPTDVLLKDLWEQEESAWKHFGRRGDPINQKEAATILKLYHVTPQRGLANGNRVRGYHVSQFREAFTRFLSTSMPEEVALCGVILHKDQQGTNRVSFEQEQSGESQQGSF